MMNRILDIVARLIRLEAYSHWFKSDGVDGVPVNVGGFNDWVYATDDGTSSGAALTESSLFVYDINNGFDWVGDGDGSYVISIASDVISLSALPAIPDVDDSTATNDILVGDGGGGWDAQTIPFGLLYSDGTNFANVNGNGVVQVVSGVSVSVDELDIDQLVSSDLAGNYVVTVAGDASISLTGYSPPDIEDSAGTNEILVGDGGGGWDNQAISFGLLYSDGTNFSNANGNGVVQVVSGVSVTVDELDIDQLVSSDTDGDYAVNVSTTAVSLTTMSSVIASYLSGLSGYGGGGALHDDLTWY